MLRQQPSCALPRIRRVPTADFLDGGVRLARSPLHSLSSIVQECDRQATTQPTTLRTSHPAIAGSARGFSADALMWLASSPIARPSSAWSVPSWSNNTNELKAAATFGLDDRAWLPTPSGHQQRHRTRRQAVTTPTIPGAQRLSKRSRSPWCGGRLYATSVGLIDAWSSSGEAELFLAMRLPAEARVAHGCPLSDDLLEPAATRHARDGCVLLRRVWPA